MDRNEALNQKRGELQLLLEQWVQEVGILAPGEQIRFSLRIEAIPLVARDEHHEQDFDVLAMSIDSFFTQDRATQAGVAVQLMRVCRMRLARDRVHTIGELLQRRRIRNVGPQKIQTIQKILETAGLSLDEQLLERARRAEEGPRSRTSIPEKVTPVPLQVPLNRMLIRNFFTKDRAREAGIGLVPHTGNDLSWIVTGLTGYNALGIRTSPPGRLRELNTMADVVACSPEEIRKMLGAGELTNALFRAMLESAGLHLRDEKS